MILDHLAMVLRHVDQGARHIVQQRDLITRFERAGIDSAEAQRLLAQFEHSQSQHIEHRNRLQAMLANSNCDPTRPIKEATFKSQVQNSN